jgi:small subunit ribosomal protein S3
LRTARPGVVVGRGGAGIEALRAWVQKLLKDPSRQIRVNVVEVSRVDADAALVAEYIIQQLERRVSFRRVVRQAIQRAQRAGVEGIKIQVSGRLNGAEIARTEWTAKAGCLCIRYGPMWTMPTPQPKLPMAFWVLRYGFLRVK